VWSAAVDSFNRSALDYLALVESKGESAGVELLYSLIPAQPVAVSA
jgi:hypothetical protein